MCTPPKRTQWREDLQHFRKEHGFSKKVLLNCCLVRRIISWASPNTKGRTQNTGNKQKAESQTQLDVLSMMHLRSNLISHVGLCSGETFVS